MGRNDLDRNGGISRRDLAALQARRMAGAAQMSVMSWIGLVLSIALGLYLFVALLLPEKFE